MSNLKIQFESELEKILIDKIVADYAINRTVVLQLCKLAKNDAASLHKCYEIIVGKHSFYSEEVTIIAKDKSCIVQINDMEEVILQDDFLKALVHVMDIVNPVLPLGTIVNLKKDYLRKLTSDKQLDKALFVITKRFLFTDDAAVYFTYAGTPYPVGNLGIKGDFNFTDTLIDEVVHMGYRDEQEETFVYMMKRELILEKGYMSIGYASEEERRKFRIGDDNDG